MQPIRNHKALRISLVEHEAAVQRGCLLGKPLAMALIFSEGFSLKSN